MSQTKRYPAQKGRLYTEKKVDKDGREYQEFVTWEYSVKPKEAEGNHD
jgi:hypothetical protein